MSERSAPTHSLTIVVPLNLSDAFDYHPVEVALNVVMSVSRLAFDGVVCDDIHVSLDEVAP